MSISGDLLKKYGAKRLIGTGGGIDMHAFLIIFITLEGTYTNFWIKEFKKKLEEER